MTKKLAPHPPVASEPAPLDLEALEGVSGGVVTPALNARRPNVQGVGSVGSQVGSVGGTGIADVAAQNQSIQNVLSAASQCVSTAKSSDEDMNRASSG